MTGIVKAQSGPSSFGGYKPMPGWPYAEPTDLPIIPQKDAAEQRSATLPALPGAAAPFAVFPFIKASYAAIVEQYKSLARTTGSTIGS
eukprot:scaffold6548_cov53-Prasinocladus_malaysianus.AAC.1